jgi:hypothetical protein
MSSSQEDELLSIVSHFACGRVQTHHIFLLTSDLKLLVSLRNAAATFGEGSAPYESIRASVEQHVQSMKEKGQTTNITQTRQPIESASEAPAALSFGSLAFRPKPRTN